MFYVQQWAICVSPILAFIMHNNIGLKGLIMCTIYMHIYFILIKNKGKKHIDIHTSILYIQIKIKKTSDTNIKPSKFIKVLESFVIRLL